MLNWSAKWRKRLDCVDIASTNRVSVKLFLLPLIRLVYPMPSPKLSCCMMQAYARQGKKTRQGNAKQCKAMQCKAMEYKARQCGHLCKKSPMQNKRATYENNGHL